MDIQRYVLKKYDRDLITFDLYKESLDTYQINIISKSDNTDDFPNGVYDSSTLLSWIRRRTIPKNRAFVLEILESQGIEPNDLIALLNVSKGLSVNDVYWIVEEGFDGAFDKYNLFENDFSKVLSLIAYTGEYSKNVDSPISPEWTTSGNLPKCWRRIDKKLYLYKAGTDKKVLINRSGNEPYSEYYVSKILDYLNIRHVKYDLEVFEGRLASVCECFCSLKYSYVPMCDVVKTSNYGELKSVIKQYGFESDFSDMILIDALTYNGDRHYNNFGFIKDNETNEFVSLAPLYDHGLCLFSNLSDYSISDVELMKNEIKSADISKWNISHKDLLLDNINDDTVSKLIKMKQYRIEEHNKYNLNDIRIRVLNMTIQNRVNELLDYITDKDSDDAIQRVLDEANRTIEETNILLK